MRRASVALPVGLFLLVAPGGAAPPPYVGPTACLPCHEKIVVAARSHRHSRAFASLAATADQANVTCVGCHVTGFGQPGGFRDEAITPALADVTCEACHGAAAPHVADPTRAPLYPRPGPDRCRLCHTAAQDSAFDYATMKGTIHQVKEANR
jgi:hypothetical protein